jgi:ribonuclease P protein component
LPEYLLRHSLNNAEKLKGHKALNLLFSGGKYIDKGNIRAYWQLVETGPSKYPAQAAFAVSKKNIPRAVDRNRIKRLMRESYRQRKPHTYLHLQQSNKFVWIVFLYRANFLDTFNNIDSKIALILKRLNESI